jgi:predicted flap endonuclease-1-like 5' DNA nuclease
MADESLNLLQSPSEIEEIELEELDDSADITGEFARAGAQSSAGRISSPPPLPAAALEPRRASAPPGSLPPPPAAAGTTVPPAPPKARTVRPPPPRSGMFLIDHERRLPPLPASSAPTLRGGTMSMAEVELLSSELRELRAQNDRLRLTVRLREDRIGELEKIASEQRARADALEARLAQLPEPPQGDDLKRIAGIGPGFERALRDAGVTTFQQIAEWTLEDVERIARQLKTAPARIVRGGWVERARELVAGS